MFPMLSSRTKWLPVGAVVAFLLLLSQMYRSDMLAAVGGAPAAWGRSRAKPGQVVMVTASAGLEGFQSIPNLKTMVYENRRAYAERWGYEFMWANISSYDFGAKIYWNKIPILQDAMRRYPHAEWFWWLDLDIIIMTPSLDLHSHVLSPAAMQRTFEFDQPIYSPGGGDSGFRTPAAYDYDGVNFIIANGGWGMNVGSFLMRRGQWSDWLLEMWADPLATKQDWIFPENDGWTHMWQNHQIVRDHTGLTSQRVLNAYPPYNSLGKNYAPGDLLVHFAGCGAWAECPQRWDDMWQIREKYDVPASVTQALLDGSAPIEAVQKDTPM